MSNQKKTSNWGEKINLMNIFDKSFSKKFNKIGKSRFFYEFENNELIIIINNPEEKVFNKIIFSDINFLFNNIEDKSKGFFFSTGFSVFDFSDIEDESNLDEDLINELKENNNMKFFTITLEDIPLFSFKTDSFDYEKINSKNGFDYYFHSLDSSFVYIPFKDGSLNSIEIKIIKTMYDLKEKIPDEEITSNFIDLLSKTLNKSKFPEKLSQELKALFNSSIKKRIIKNFNNEKINLNQMNYLLKFYGDYKKKLIKNIFISIFFVPIVVISVLLLLAIIKYGFKRFFG